METQQTLQRKLALKPTAGKKTPVHADIIHTAHITNNQDTKYYLSLRPTPTEHPAAHAASADTCLCATVARELEVS